MTEYEKDLAAHPAFPPLVVEMPFGRVLAEHSLFQLRVSESEKERFVTYYFNGQREAPFSMEEHLIVPSPKVPTYDQKPEMSAYEMTTMLIKKIQEQKYAFILVNFANTDMVGHTGSMQATIKAIECLDDQLKKLHDEIVIKRKGTLIVTADHGKAEEMFDAQAHQYKTAHTTHPVLCIIAQQALAHSDHVPYIKELSDIAPFIKELLSLD